MDRYSCGGMPDFRVQRARTERAVRAAAVDLLLVDDAGGVRAEAPPGTAADAGGDHDDGTAYVMFTSGSTGIPKGVPVPHRAAVAHLEYVTARYGLGPGCRLSHWFDLTFDLSLFDVFAAWGSGATLVVPARSESMNPVGYVNDRSVTHWFSVPSVIGAIRGLRSLPPGCMPALRWSLFCGERLTWRDASRAATVPRLPGSAGQPRALPDRCGRHGRAVRPRRPADRRALVPHR